MATVDELTALEKAYQKRIQQLNTQIDAIVQEANASGKPQWTDDLLRQRDEINAVRKPVADRWNRLLRLRDAREFVLHLKYERREYAGDWGVNETYVVGDTRWPVDGDLDTANAEFLRKHDLPQTFAECEASGHVDTDIARYLEARDLDAQEELSHFQNEQTRALLNTFIEARAAFVQAREDYNNATPETDAATFAALAKTSSAMESSLGALYPVAVRLYREANTADERTLYTEIAEAMSDYYNGKLPWAY